MSDFYDDLAAAALDALSEFGQTVTRRAVASGAYDPATGATVLTTADTARTGALFNYGQGVTAIRGTLVQINDKQLLLDATDTVDADDLFIVGGVTYSIVSIGEVNPAGTRVLYDLHVRAA